MRGNLRLPARLAAAVTGLTLVAGLHKTPAHADSLDDLYALAKQERTLVMWAAGPSAGYESAARSFEQRFPGITVSLKGGFSNVLNAQIEEQLNTNKLESDIVVLQTIQDLVGWNARGLLLHFKPDEFDRVRVSMRDRDGAWIALSTNPIFYAYNTDKLRLEDIPTSAIDFLKTRFKGKLISAYPADDDATLYAFNTIVRKYGWGYMDQYRAQMPRYIQGHLGVARSLASGESWATFDATVSTMLSVRREGGKVELTGPKDDLVPVFFAAEAILKNAPHPNAAKLYVTWFLSRQWQSQLGVYSSRQDVPAPAGLPRLMDYRLDDHYLEFLTNENLPELRRRFETYTGPVTNVGDVR
ncbi:MAG TPA: extracellular solute-binding protein [Xanthobacteraceae bacterium]|jgi:ABC-type Fe3+ transport system substrate-binding protein